MQERRFPGAAAAAVRASRRLAVAVVMAAALLPAAGCRREGPRPDVLLVTIDTLRRDHCSLYGYPVKTTPNLDALASRGITFEDAYAESATTAPSHAVLMTGRHFRTNGVTKNGAAIPKDDLTLAEVLRSAGYRTAAFVSSFPLLTRFGFSQGFDAYDDNFEMEQASIGRRKEDSVPHDRYAGATLEHAAGWLAENPGDQPLFLWVHFVDPHAPYKAPEKFDAHWPEGTPGPVKRYDAEVHYADEALGRLLAMLEKRRPGRERLVVVTSDHGEGLGDHGWQSHGINLYQEVVRIPLVASWPGHLEAGRKVQEPVGLVDIAPSILGLLGIGGRKEPGFADGQDLFSARADRAIFLQRRDYHSTKEKGVKVEGEMTAIVEGGTKFVLAPAEGRRELYDLKDDPKELADLLGGARPARLKKPRKGEPPPPPPPASPPTPVREAQAHKLEKELDAWRREHPAVRTSEEPLDKDAVKALRSLGYVD